MMMLVLKVVKVNLVITVVVVEEEIVGSIFRVNTAATGCSETWVNTYHLTQCQKPEDNNTTLHHLEIIRSNSSLNDCNYHTFYPLDSLSHRNCIGPSLSEINIHLPNLKDCYLSPL